MGKMKPQYSKKKNNNRSTNKKAFHKGNKSKKQLFDGRARLIIRNLSFRTTEENLKKHFEIYGNVCNVNLLKRPNGDLVGCGFIQFEDVDSAKQALSSVNSKQFLGRAIQVDWAVPKDEYISTNKKSTPGEEDLTNSKKFIKNEKIKIEKDNDVKEERGENRVNNKVKKARLIVRNISFKATEETLKEYFTKYGEVLESTLLKKPNGDLVGCGFIQMKDVQSAAKAILKANAQPFLGRSIHVDWAVAKNKYMSHVIQKKDEEELLKNDVKSEPESDDETTQSKNTLVSDVSVKEESGSDEEGHCDNEGESHDSDSSNEPSDNEDVEEQNNDNLRVSANDAEDGKTIFLKNVPFSVTNEDLQEFAGSFGEIQYALVCVDKLKEHSKGTAFVRFKNKEDADIFISSGPERLSIEGQTIEALPAMFRDKLKGKDIRKKQPKDSRNLYLIKEGVILANSKAANGVSASDIAKRLSLEQNKSQMLRNLNRFISKYRLTIHNIPLHYTDEDLRTLCISMANVKPHCIKECRVMRHLKGPLGPNGKHVSKGYGFVMFTKHEDALTCLRRLNNHPSIFDINNRPIVSFSIEDRAILNARKKRLEKSQIKNPQSKSYIPPTPEEKSENNNQRNENQSKSKQSKNFKNNALKDEKSSKNNAKSIQNKKKKHAIHENNAENSSYTGAVAEPGNVRMRSKFKLKNEMLAHRENLKADKRKKRAAQRVQVAKKKEKVKQPKQKHNTSVKSKVKHIMEKKDDKKFSELVNKYKSKLTNSSQPQRVKAKWFE